MAAVNPPLTFYIDPRYPPRWISPSYSGVHRGRDTRNPGGSSLIRRPHPSSSFQGAEIRCALTREEPCLGCTHAPTHARDERTSGRVSYIPLQTARPAPPATRQRSLPFQGAQVMCMDGDSGMSVLKLYPCTLRIDYSNTRPVACIYSLLLGPHPTPRIL
ncbi:hypothetical protein LX32DRAFT_10831 [Colletotrichum zoysiae]|uniref:Uncharacterized protein n=1 Tax=Colletotrichum zoysiae TaxID=1216348 RepID=A0AAD9HCZ0_9PEZI|nr:hypothetical protein LX32DRAFT_10831 [Colletotrichum zoysiae]